MLTCSGMMRIGGYAKPQVIGAGERGQGDHHQRAHAGRRAGHGITDLKTRLRP